MNERIQQLKHQASLWCDMNIPDQFGEYGYGEAWEDKFAELIVRECITTIDDEIGRLTEYSNSIDDAYMKHNVDICIEKCLDNIHNVKQHFGIEE